jgi:membrane associated rhomboid family serine protease
MHSSGGPLANAARNLRQIMHSPASWMWLVIVLAIHGLVETQGGPIALGWWFEEFGLSREEFRTGNIWQVFSYGFLHGGWWHVGLNGLFVLVIGSRIEHMAGASAVLRVTALGILSGGLCHLIFGSGLLVGLSGGCVALLLLLTTLSPQSRMFPLPVSGKSLGLGILLAELVLALIDPALGVPGLSGAGRALERYGMGSCFQMGHACHFGGGVAGWLFGRWLLRPRITLDRLRRDRARREAG